MYKNGQVFMKIITVMQTKADWHVEMNLSVCMVQHVKVRCVGKGVYVKSRKERGKFG